MAFFLRLFQKIFLPFHVVPKNYAALSFSGIQIGVRWQRISFPFSCVMGPRNTTHQGAACFGMTVVGLVDMRGQLS